MWISLCWSISYLFFQHHLVLTVIPCAFFFLVSSKPLWWFSEPYSLSTCTTSYLLNSIGSKVFVAIFCQCSNMIKFGKVALFQHSVFGYSFPDVSRYNGYIGCPCMGSIIFTKVVILHWIVFAASSHINSTILLMCYLEKKWVNAFKN